MFRSTGSSSLGIQVSIWGLKFVFAVVCILKKCEFAVLHLNTNGLTAFQIITATSKRQGTLWTAWHSWWDRIYSSNQSVSNHLLTQNLKVPQLGQQSGISSSIICAFNDPIYKNAMWTHAASSLSHVGALDAKSRWKFALLCHSPSLKRWKASPVASSQEFGCWTMLGFKPPKALAFPHRLWKPKTSTIYSHLVVYHCIIDLICWESQQISKCEPEERRVWWQLGCQDCYAMIDADLLWSSSPWFPPTWDGQFEAINPTATFIFRSLATMSAIGCDHLLDMAVVSQWTCQVLKSFSSGPGTSLRSSDRPFFGKMVAVDQGVCRGKKKAMVDVGLVLNHHTFMVSMVDPEPLGHHVGLSADSFDLVFFPRPSAARCK